MARFLCTADVHVGRASATGGDDAGQDHSALAAWEHVVGIAVEEGADAVLIAGDFFDSLSAQYENRRRVQASFEQLKRKGILAVAVAGNHDYQALPDFARLHSDLLHVMPSDQWGSIEVKGVRIMGRSFPGEQHRDSMLRGFPAPTDGMPTIGLLHADVDVVSPYNPVRSADFDLHGVNAWVVGHVHARKEYREGKVFYPGSPQALDWGETGEHGFCWMQTRTLEREFVPVSTVRYEYMPVALQQNISLDEALKGRISQLRGQDANRRLLSIQLRVDLRLEPGDQRDFPEAAPIDNDWYEVCSRAVVPVVNLESEATQSDARGQAARLLLGLDGRGDRAWAEHAQRLVGNLEKRMNDERSNLRLPATESVRMLQPGPGSDTATQAVRRALERILAAGEVAP